MAATKKATELKGRAEKHHLGPDANGERESAKAPIGEVNVARGGWVSKGTAHKRAPEVAKKKGEVVNAAALKDKASVPENRGPTGDFVVASAGKVLKDTTDKEEAEVAFMKGEGKNAAVVQKTGLPGSNTMGQDAAAGPRGHTGKMPLVKQETQTDNREGAGEAGGANELKPDAVADGKGEDLWGVEPELIQAVLAEQDESLAAPKTAWAQVAGCAKMYHRLRGELEGSGRERADQATQRLIEHFVCLDGARAEAFCNAQNHFSAELLSIDKDGSTEAAQGASNQLLEQKAEGVRSAACSEKLLLLLEELLRLGLGLGNTCTGLPKLLKRQVDINLAALFWMCSWQGLFSTQLGQLPMVTVSYLGKVSLAHDFAMSCN